MGPQGSGKTICCLMEPLMRAIRQPPSIIDGIRYHKCAVIRDTYRNLEETTIPSWHTWFPKDLGEWKGTAPYSHHLVMDLPNVGVIDLLMEFIALGENRVEDVMRGWEGTSGYLNEADRLPPDVLTFVRGRLGRYPATLHGELNWYGLWMDFNAPDTESYLYDLLVENIIDGISFFVQPSGLSPQAENLEHLVPGYYDNMIVGQPDWWIRRFVLNQWGYSREGKPVYPEFNDQLHVAGDDLVPVKGIPLLLGADAGLSPAGIIKQHMPNGQWRILDELVTEQGTGPTRFSEYLTQTLNERYFDMKVQGWADPSSFYGGDEKGGDANWIEMVSAKTGISFRPGPTNDIVPRLEAVRVPLTRMIDGHTPGFLLSPRCKVLRKGFNAGYRYRRRTVAASSSYDPVPEKNEFSHPHDALQYGLSGGGEHTAVMGRKQARNDLSRQAYAITDEAEEIHSDNPRARRRRGGHQAFAEND